MRTAAIVLGAMLAVPMTGLAAVPGQTSATAPKSLKPASTKSTSTTTHSTQGVVKSVDSNSLVIEHSGKDKKKTEMTFALDATTHRAGDINVGSKVAVRYKKDASKLLALDIEPAKAKGAAHKAAAH
jgi:hypothetical protein